MVPIIVSVLGECPSSFLPLSHASRLLCSLPLWSVHISTWCFCAGAGIKWACVWALEEWVFCSLWFSSFPGYIPYCSKPGVLRACFSCLVSKELRSLKWSSNPSLLGNIAVPLQFFQNCHLGCGVFFHWHNSMSVSPTHLDAVTWPFVLETLGISFSGLFLRGLLRM